MLQKVNFLSNARYIRNALETLRPLYDVSWLSSLSAFSVPVPNLVIGHLHVLIAHHHHHSSRSKLSKTHWWPSQVWRSRWNWMQSWPVMLSRQQSWLIQSTGQAVSHMIDTAPAYGWWLMTLIPSIRRSAISLSVIFLRHSIKSLWCNNIHILRTEILFDCRSRNFLSMSHIVLINIEQYLRVLSRYICYENLISPN